MRYNVNIKPYRRDLHMTRYRFVSRRRRRRSQNFTRFLPLFFLHLAVKTQQHAAASRAL